MAFAAVFYGVLAFILSFLKVLYQFTFTRNRSAKKGIDAGPTEPLPHALIVDVLLIGVFALQRKIHASFDLKQLCTRLVPHAVKRTTLRLLTKAPSLLRFLALAGSVSWFSIPIFSGA